MSFHLNRTRKSPRNPMINAHFSTTLPLPELARDTVHVFSQPLDDLTSQFTQELIKTLQPDELARAQRLLRPSDQIRFKQVRGILRVILGRYLKSDPREIRFDYGPFGQPRILQRLENLPLHFNVSHSQQHAVFAFALQHRVGVDIEFARPLQHMQKMLDHICTTQENAELRNFDADSRLRLFFRLWTRKEALLKAVGLGLHGGLRTYNIGWATATFDQPLFCHGPENKPWQIIDLPCGTGIEATLAIEL